MYKERKKCASCGNDNLTFVHDFGNVPLAGDFPTKCELSAVNSYQLSLLFCDNCKLVQTNSVISPEVLFSDYRYKSSIGLTQHFNSYVDWFVSKFGKSDSKILEIGCNDGVLLSPMKSKGFDMVGVDPAKNIIKPAVSSGLDIYCDYFSTEFVLKNDFKNNFEFILANNSFAHIDNILDVVDGVSLALKPGGHFIVEVHYVLNLLQQFQYDTIYHEHIYYYSLNSLQNLLSPYGFNIVDFEYLNTHSGSIRVVFQKGGLVGETVKHALLTESDAGITEVNTYIRFSTQIKKHSSKFIDTIRTLKSEGKTIFGYGASGRANMFCNTLKLTNDDIGVIFDESDERIGRYIPISNIPILDAKQLGDVCKDVDVENVIIVIFAWNYTNMIISKLKSYNFKFLIPFPDVIVTDSDYISRNTL